MKLQRSNLFLDELHRRRILLLRLQAIQHIEKVRIQWRWLFPVMSVTDSPTRTFTQNQSQKLTLL